VAEHHEIGGEQYVLVMAGNGGGLPLTLPAFDGPQPRPPGRVLAFKLGGKASLPPAPPAPALPAPPAERWTPRPFAMRRQIAQLATAQLTRAQRLAFDTAFRALEATPRRSWIQVWNCARKTSLAMVTESWRRWTASGPS